MPVIYDSVNYICENIFKEYKTKQWHQRYCNSRKKPKTSAFADDATIYIGSNSSLAYLETQLMDFEKVTDIKYNKTKCMRIGLGFNKYNPRKPLGFKSNSDTIKIFGYTYGHNIFIHLHFIYSWQSLIIYYNRFFFNTKKKTSIYSCFL